MSSLVPGPLAPASATRRGTQSAAHFTKLEELPANATLDARLDAIEADVTTLEGSSHSAVTVSSPTGWLSLLGQALTFALVAASDTVAGVVSLGAQTFAGVKTFAGAIIASAGIQVASLFNTNGTIASDVVVKVGTSQADASVNASAKLLVLATGLGGTEVESLSFLKGGQINGAGGSLTINNSAGARLQWGSNQLVLLAGSGELATVGTTVVRSTSVNTDQAKMYSAAGGAGTRAVVLGTSAADGGVNAAAQLTAFGTAVSSAPNIKAFVTAGGEFESTVSAAGIVLKSPNGTRWRLTITNAGAVNVVAA